MKKLSMNGEKATPWGEVQAPSAQSLQIHPHACPCGRRNPHSNRTVVNCGQHCLRPDDRVTIAPESVQNSCQLFHAQQEVHMRMMWMTCAWNCMSLINAQNT